MRLHFSSSFVFSQSRQYNRAVSMARRWVALQQDLQTKSISASRASTDGVIAGPSLATRPTCGGILHTTWRPRCQRHWVRRGRPEPDVLDGVPRSEEHTSELQ